MPSISHAPVRDEEGSGTPLSLVRLTRRPAPCQDNDPELFFPIGNVGPAALQVAQAKAVCRDCSVVEACLRYALDTGQDAGVWGGLSEEERRALKRRNARARRAS